MRHSAACSSLTLDSFRAHAHGHFFSATFLEDPCAGPSLRRNAAHVVSSLQLCSGRVRANWKSP
eukprot:3127778-Amphidinium_carterae.1